MIECSEGQWWVACDKCSDAEGLNVAADVHFSEVVQAVREAGFAVERDEAREEWRHTCMRCREDLVNGRC